MLRKLFLASCSASSTARCRYSTCSSEYFEDYDEQFAKNVNVERFSTKIQRSTDHFKSKNGLNSPSSKYFSSSKTRSRSMSAERFEKPRKYYENCKKIKRHQDMKTISPLTLAYIPINCVLLNEDMNFVDEFLLPWWYAFSERFNEVEIIDLCNVLVALRKIDNVTNGSVLARIGHENLLTLVDYVFDSVTKLYPKTMATLLTSLQFLFSNSSVEDKSRLQKKISSALSVYISFLLNNKSSKYAEDLDKYIDQILFKSIQLGVPPPSAECIHDIITACSRLLFDRAADSSSHDLSTRTNHDIRFDNLTSLNRLASAFLFWQIDVGQFSKTFWPAWYKKTLPMFNRSDGFTMAMFLRNNLLLALAFKQEAEFFKFKRLWMEKFNKNKHSLPFVDVISMASQIRSKLDDCSNEQKTFYRDVLHELAEIV